MIKTLEFKGKSFQIEYVETYATHPTWYSFEDERDVREAFWNPGPGDIVLDIGACVGSYTLPALASGACVYAWAPGRLHEGTKENDLLRVNGRANHGFSERLIIFSTGLYSATGALNTKTLEFRREQAGKDVDWLNVLKLDDLSLFPNWMKLDVEGAELEVLKGAEQTIRKHRPKILTECHLNVDPSIAYEVNGLLLKLGYKLEGSIRHPASNVVHTFHVPV